VTTVGPPRRSRRALLAALRRAEEGIKVRDDLLASIFDELSTRLATLMLTVEVLADGNCNGDKAALVRLIERQVRRMGSLNASLLTGNQADGRRTPDG
jgi:signal transduction histidine kinase